MLKPPIKIYKKALKSEKARISKTGAVCCLLLCSFLSVLEKSKKIAKLKHCQSLVCTTNSM